METKADFQSCTVDAKTLQHTSENHNYNDLIAYTKRQIYRQMCAAVYSFRINFTIYLPVEVIIGCAFTRTKCSYRKATVPGITISVEC